MGCPALLLGLPFLCLVLVALFSGSPGCVVGVLDAVGVFAAIVGLGLALTAEVMQAVIALDPVFCCFKSARALLVCFKSASRVVVLIPSGLKCFVVAGAVTLICSVGLGLAINSAFAVSAQYVFARGDVGLIIGVDDHGCSVQVFFSRISRGGLRVCNGGLFFSLIWHFVLL
ncbi:hypothetical protein U1Q18_034804 [Sarracenia purpurea var. burkii]